MRSAISHRIIAVDYDGTLENDSKMNMTLIGRLRAEQRRGSVVILWTCREGESLVEAVNCLRACGFRPNLINENDPDVIKKFGRNPRKVYADVYIDDKAVR